MFPGVRQPLCLWRNLGSVKTLCSVDCSNMDAIRFTPKTKKLECIKIPIPEICKSNDVLIQVAYAGVCGTDVHIIQGEFPCKDDTLTMGHEYCGTVVEVAPSVKQFKNGDRVAVDPSSGCNCCEFCRSGNPHFCASGGINNYLGMFRDGGWAQYAIAPVEQVHKVPDSITFEQAALTEPLSCLSHSWDVISPITVGMTILILGAGIIGSLSACQLHLQGHRNVTVSEPSAARLNMIHKLNIGYTLLKPEDLKKNQECDSNYLFDLIIDCSGHPPAIEHAITLLQKGGKFCLFGVAPLSDSIKVKPFDIFMKEWKIMGVLTNPLSFPKSLGLIAAMGDRYLNYENLGIQTFALKDYKKAIELLKAGAIAKAMFKMC